VVGDREPAVQMVLLQQLIRVPDCMIFVIALAHLLITLFCLSPATASATASNSEAVQACVYVAWHSKSDAKNNNGIKSVL
jgi:hypothetical protein